MRWTVVIEQPAFRIPHFQMELFNKKKIILKLRVKSHFSRDFWGFAVYHAMQCEEIHPISFCSCRKKPGGPERKSTPKGAVGPPLETPSTASERTRSIPPPRTRAVSISTPPFFLSNPNRCSDLMRKNGEMDASFSASAGNRAECARFDVAALPRFFPTTGKKWGNMPCTASRVAVSPEEEAFGGATRAPILAICKESAKKRPSGCGMLGIQL